MNYAETLAYWYLRLNGFIPMSRFVIHRDGGEHVADEDRYRSDSDLVAVRHPGVFERVGQNHWDTELFGLLSQDNRRFDRDQDTVALIVEVKGGKETASPDRAFERSRLFAAVSRIGKLSGDYDFAAVADFLVAHPVWTSGSVHVAKLLIGLNCPDGIQSPTLHDDQYLVVSLAHATEFLRDRIDLEVFRKSGEWDLFPSDLFQFLIWSRDLGL